VFLEEKDCSIFNVGASWKDGQVINSVELQGKSELRLVRKDAVRCDIFPCLARQTAATVWCSCEQSIQS
jgi:hypothetical protein